MSRPADGNLIVKRWLPALGVAAAALALAVALWPEAAPPATGASATAVESRAPSSVVVALPDSRGVAPAAVSSAARGRRGSRERPAENGEGARVTNVELLERYVDEVCACPDLACFDEVRDHYARNMGKTTRAVDNRPMRAIFAREEVCIEKLRGQNGG